MNLRHRMAQTLLRREYEDLQHNARMLGAILDRRNYLLEAPDIQEVIQQNPRSLHHRRDILLTGTADVTERERLDAVAESRRLWRRTPLGNRIVGLWTDYGFGQNVEIAPREDSAGEVWEEFWTARRNTRLLRARDLHRLSDAVLTDGELFFVAFIDKATGQTTLRTAPTEEWTEFVTDPDDDTEVMFYKREWTDSNGKPQILYYRDWLFDEATMGQTSLGDAEGKPDDYPSDDVRADMQVAGTDVVVLHAARDQDDRMRGWPLLTTSAYWIRAYDKLTNDLLSVAERNALYGAHVRVKGGSRAVDRVMQALQSAMTSSTATYETNPPPPAGSDFVSNEAVEMVDPPLNRAVTESENASNSTIALAGLGGGVFPHYLGKGEAFRLATATAMEGPVLRQWMRYQAWWADVWREMVHMVLWAAQTYGGITYETDVYDENGNAVGTEPVDATQVEVDVSTDALIEQDLEQFSTALVNLSAFVPDAETLTRLALQALNVPDMQDVLDRIYPPEQQTQEVALRRVDFDTLRASLRILIEEGNLETAPRIWAEQARSIVEDGGNGHG